MTPSFFIKLRPESPAASIVLSLNSVIVLYLFPLRPLSLSYFIISPLYVSSYTPLPVVHIHILLLLSVVMHLILTLSSTLTSSFTELSIFCVSIPTFTFSLPSASVTASPLSVPI